MVKVHYKRKHHIVGEIVVDGEINVTSSKAQPIFEADLEDA
jgi:hypothetical protein